MIPVLFNCLMTKGKDSLTDNFFKFLDYTRENGIQYALYYTFQYLGLIPDIDFFNLKNSLRFNDPRIYFACDIYQVLPESTTLQHPVGIVISSNAELGEDMKIHQNTTIGSNLGGQPTIEDEVFIAAGAAVIGDVTVGKNAIIGANSTVLSDIPPNSVAAGSPAEVVRKKDVDEES